MANVAGLLVELGELVDRLLACAEAEAEVLDSAQLHEVTIGLQRERDRLAVAAGDVVHRWDQRGAWRADGSLRASAALGRDCRSSEETASRELRRGRALQRMAVVRAAVIDGRLSTDHVDLLARVATPARWEMFTRHEAMIVERLAALPLFDDGRRVVRYWAQLVDDVLDRRRDRPEPSTLYASRHGTTGELHLEGLLDPVDGEIVERELARLGREITAEDRAGGVDRTPAQRRAAALVRMATRSTGATGTSARPLFQVIVGEATAARLCELASGTVVHPDDLAPHIDRAVVESFLFDGPRVVIAKTNQRTFTGALRRAIQVRDRRCQHPSVCDVRADRADVDHRTPWAAGGDTSQENGRIQCTPHNRIAHLHDPPGSPPPGAPGSSSNRVVGDQPRSIHRRSPVEQRMEELRCRIRHRSNLDGYGPEVLPF